MEFFTISQYFNRLNSILLSILLLPIFVFLILYLFLSTSPDAAGEAGHKYIYYAIVFTNWTFIFILFNKKIKTIRKMVGLGLKLKHYFRLTIVRFSLGSVGCLVLAVGYYLSGDELLTLIFVASLGLFVFMWPRGPKVCADLRLRGDEREMVYFRKDEF